MNAPDDTVVVRNAVEDDVDAIREIFGAVYGGDYPYQRFYDSYWLKKSIFSDDILTLIAEEDGRPVGTASVVYSAGAHSDFVGEFGRLSVHPDARGRGIGRRLMEVRLDFAAERLHAGIVENRTEHTFSQRISAHHGFAPVGFLPLKHRFGSGHRESIALYVRHFGPALELRDNDPRVVPEAHTLAHLALRNCGLPDDVIVDDAARPYAHSDGFHVDTFDSDDLAQLLRIQRGRVRNREVFGPIRLHYGFFKISDRNGSYIVARDGEDGPLVGAIGFLHDEYESTIRVFEVISRSDEAPRFLFEQLVEEAREQGVEYIEVDVSAHAPRMQRTLIELGFLPAGYIPALVFDDVERVDVVKMVRLLIRPHDDPQLTEAMQRIASTVMEPFRQQSVLPQVWDAVDEAGLFGGLDDRQRRIVAALGEVHRLDEGASLFVEDERADAMYIVVAGQVGVIADGARVGRVTPGESLGEVSLLNRSAHSAAAIVDEDATVVSFSRDELDRVIRRHPDIGLILYRNLAAGLGDKLKRVDKSLAGT